MPTREAARPLRGPAPEARPDETAKVAKLVGTTLYVPTTDLEARFGTDPKPLGDYNNALKKRADAILAQAEPAGATGLLVAVGIKAARRPRVWCQAVEGEVPAALLRTLERELTDVEAVELRQGPAGVGLKFALNGKTPSRFPEVPDRWTDAAESSRSKKIIPPDDLFIILWPE